MSGNISERLPQIDLDHSFDLEELLSGVDVDKLLRSLGVLTGLEFALLNEGDDLVAGKVLDGTDKGAPISVDLEPIGSICASTASAEINNAAAVLFMAILKCNYRYKIASEMHLRIVQADYDELQRRHDELKESERKYRELSDSLERRVAEQVDTIENAQRQLYQAEKMASVGQLASGVAHEINTPIGFIQSNMSTAQGYVEKLQNYAALLKSKATYEELSAEWSQQDMDYVVEDFALLVKESLDGSRRVAKIVGDLKGFSRADSIGKEYADLNEVLRKVCSVAKPKMGSGELKLKLQPVPSVLCDAGALGQVFLNLIINAAQAMDGIGCIDIASSSQNSELQVNIKDNGPGIPEDVLPRIFDPFFTTKDVGVGTGLGLTVCNDVVKSHGGKLLVDSVVGSGTTFTIVIPLIKAA